MRKIANSVVQGGMSLVMLVNQIPMVWAQQGVNVLNSNANGIAAPANSSPVVTPSIGTSGSAVPSYPDLAGCQARNAEQSAVSNAQLIGCITDLVGKLVTLPYSIPQTMVRGTASAATTTAFTVVTAPGSGISNYITSVQCFRTDAATTAVTVTFNDTNTAVFVMPNNGGGGGFAVTFPIPVKVVASTAFQATLGVAIATVWCNAQGYTGV